MSELRKDPVVGRWVIIATERARRPGNLVDPQREVFEDSQQCPFCHNQEAPVYLFPADKPQDWKVRVVPSGTAVLNVNEKFQRRGHGLYDVVPAHGVHDVVIETPQHIANMADLDAEQIHWVIQAYVARFRELEKDENLQYVLAYKNYGWAAGSRRIGHSRSQIMGSCVNPLRVKEKLVGAKRYYDYHDRCVYCDLIRQEKETKSRIVIESEHFIVLTPFAPRFPFELVIFPKKHHCDFARGVVGQEADLAQVLKQTLLKFKVGLDNPAYNYVIQTAPFRHAGKGMRWRTLEQDYHWHIEVVPRIARAAGFEKGTGFYICAIPPEETAAFLREVQI